MTSPKVEPRQRRGRYAALSCGEAKLSSGWLVFDGFYIMLRARDAHSCKSTIAICTDLMYLTFSLLVTTCVWRPT